MKHRGPAVAGTRPVALNEILKHVAVNGVEKMVACTFLQALHEPLILPNIDRGPVIASNIN